MFSTPKPVIGMIHVGALPGTPASRATLRELEEQAVAECAVYRAAGVHGVMLENMHDVPYLRGGSLTAIPERIWSPGPVPRCHPEGAPRRTSSRANACARPKDLSA